VHCETILVNSFVILKLRAQLEALIGVRQESTDAVGFEQSQIQGLSHRNELKIIASASAGSEAEAVCGILSLDPAGDVGLLG